MSAAYNPQAFILRSLQEGPKHGDAIAAETRLHALTVRGILQQLIEEGRVTVTYADPFDTRSRATYALDLGGRDALAAPADAGTAPRVA